MEGVDREAEDFLGGLGGEGGVRDVPPPPGFQVRDVPRPPPPPGAISGAVDEDGKPHREKLSKAEKKKRKALAAAAAASEAAEATEGGETVDEAEAEMMRMMGFGGFASTAGQHVEDENVNVSAVFKKTTRRARQYMNRPGGFNRPLPDEVTGVRSNKI